MKTLLVSATAGFLALAAQAAFADETRITGTITSLDSGKHQIVLSDGQTYTLPADMQAGGFQVGDHVVITAEKKDGANMVQQIAKGG